MTVSYSCIKHLSEYPSGLIKEVGYYTGAGVTHADTHFAGSSVVPAPPSPCIDMGSNLADIDPWTPGIQFLPETDLVGHPRIMDGDSDGSEIVDMGAYEYQP